MHANHLSPKKQTKDFWASHPSTNNPEAQTQHQKKLAPTDSKVEILPKMAMTKSKVADRSAVATKPHRKLKQVNPQALFDSDSEDYDIILPAPKKKQSTGKLKAQPVPQADSGSEDSMPDAPPARRIAGSDVEMRDDAPAKYRSRRSSTVSSRSLAVGCPRGPGLHEELTRPDSREGPWALEDDGVLDIWDVAAHPSRVRGAQNPIAIPNVFLRGLEDLD
ncbi:hypothetical protein B0H13DRAFT_2336401 [Mycena leptocephala]|nr:hypothetical protein B0H13DRAFT_2336401 [Mycena leptocephala]